MPAQPLLSSTSLVDEVVAVVDQQLQAHAAAPPRVAASRAAPRQRGSGDGKRVDQVRLALHPARDVPLGGGQPGAAPAPAAADAPPSTSAPDRASRVGSPPAPTGAAGQPASPNRQAPRRRSSPVRRVAGQRHRQQQQRQSACARPPRSRLAVLASHRWGDRRADRPQSRQSCQGLSGHARRSREGGGDTTLASQPTSDDPESSQPPPPRVSVPQRTAPAENDIEFRNDASGCSGTTVTRGCRRR